MEAESFYLIIKDIQRVFWELLTFTGLRYPFTLTKAGYAMTFPLYMESAPSSLEKQPAVEELAESGSDSAKINLRSVAYRCVLSLQMSIRIWVSTGTKCKIVPVPKSFEHLICHCGWQILTWFWWQAWRRPTGDWLQMLYMSKAHSSLHLQSYDHPGNAGSNFIRDVSACSLLLSLYCYLNWSILLCNTSRADFWFSWLLLQTLLIFILKQIVVVD